MLPSFASCMSFLLLASYVACSDTSEERSLETDLPEQRSLEEDSSGEKSLETDASGERTFLEMFLGDEECAADAQESWSYSGENGPEYWGDSYPACNGNEQSPIAINRQEAVHDPGLSKLQMKNYDIPVTKATIENNGYTVQVTPTDGVDRTISVNESSYKLLQLHFHWGDDSSHGSEHTLNGIQFPLELHLVHLNANNELAVVGVFFQEQKRKNRELQNIVRRFPKVLYKGDKTELKSNLNLSNLLPENPSSFYRYQGSLTTPGCSEGVTWSVLTEPVPVEKQQMKKFRQLYSTTKADASPECKQSDNFRPVQPLNDRTVYISQ